MSDSMVKALQPPDLKTQRGRLRAAREIQFSSMRSAANENGWNENTYKSHEQGMRRDGALTEADARRYARAFGVNPSWLLTGNGDPGHSKLRQLAVVPTPAHAQQNDVHLKLEQVQDMLNEIRRSLNQTPEQAEAVVTARTEAARKLVEDLAQPGPRTKKPGRA